MLNKEASELIALWLNTNDKLRQINKIIYNKTELFEQKYMTEYRQELFSYFAAKITRYTRDENELYKLLDYQETEKVNIERAK